MREGEAPTGETQTDSSGASEFAFAPPETTPTRAPHRGAPWIRRPRLPGRERPAPPVPFETAPAEADVPVRSPRRAARIGVRSVGIVALALVLVAGTAGGWWFLHARRPDPVTLRLFFPPKGATVSRVTATLDWRSDYAPLNLELYGEFDGVLTLRTSSLDGDRAKLRAILDLSSFVVNDHPVTEPPSTSARLEMRTDGTVVRGKHLVFPGTSQTMLLGVTGLVPGLSDDPVVPGDTWTGSLRIRLGTDLFDGTTRSEFVRFEDVGEVRAAVIHGTKDLTIKSNRPLPGTGSMKVDQTAWLDPETGKVLQMTVTTQFTYHARPQAKLGGRRILIEGADRYELTAI
jgi:hypothetical protein